MVYLALRYGFQDDQDVPAALRQAAAAGLPEQIDVDQPICFVSEITIVLAPIPARAGGARSCSSRGQARPRAR